MKIIVKEEGLKSIGSNLINNSEELNSEIEKINAVIEGISGVWQGQDFNTFKEIANSKYVRNVKELSEYLKSNG